MIGPSSFDDKPDHTCPANAGPRSPRTTSRLQETGKGRGVARGEHQAGKTLLCPIPPTSTISAGPSTKAHPAKWRVFPDVRPLAIDDTIQEAIDNHAIVDFSLSGGKDSAAAAIAVSAWLDKRRHPVDLRSATHAHLGVIEWPETIDHIKNLTEKLAIPLSIVSQEKGLIDRWRRRFEAAKLRYAALECYHLIGPFSSASLRFCTSEMKTSPIRRSLSLRNPGATVISVIGVRADESPRRANAPISSIDQLPSDRSPRPKLISWNPIKDWTAQDVFDAHHAARVPLHYAYTRHAMTRLSCAFCVLASRADVENAAILDQWVRGRRRHIWVSKNQPLYEDAQRDWTAIGGLHCDILEISKWKIDETITAPEGILFVPYATLRSARSDATRLDQIIEWAGPDFEGVIAFDESHEMGGVAGGENALMKSEGSLQGIAGVQLQNRLPRARVLYASATGASEVNNLAYAVRLGLWGPQTAFADREQFITQIREGGIAAMELVARDLKAMGLYISRALSFTGIEYDILQHQLTTDQIAVYDQYADAWSIIHRNLEDALEITGIVDPVENETRNAMAKAAARSRFESCKQRFFGQVLLSFKLATLIPEIDRHLDEGASTVIQLVTTAEAILDRRLKQLDPDDFAQLDIDLSPREYV